MEDWKSIEDRYRVVEEAIELGNYADAIRLLEELASELPGEPLFLWRLGYVYCDLHQASRAIVYFKRALRIDSRSAPAWGGLAQAYMELFKWDEAELALRKRLGIKPGPHYFVFLATVLRAKGDIEGAVDSCKKAVQLDPNYDEAFYNMGVYLKQLGREDDSRNAFARAIELDPVWAERLAMAPAPGVSTSKGKSASEECSRPAASRRLP